VGLYLTWPNVELNFANEVAEAVSTTTIAYKVSAYVYTQVGSV
jgi:hypothetical protein